MRRKQNDGFLILSFYYYFYNNNNNLFIGSPAVRSWSVVGLPLCYVLWYTIHRSTSSKWLVGFVTRSSLIINNI